MNRLGTISPTLAEIEIMRFNRKAVAYTATYPISCSSYRLIMFDSNFNIKLDDNEIHDELYQMVHLHREPNNYAFTSDPNLFEAGFHLEKYAVTVDNMHVIRKVLPRIYETLMDSRIFSEKILGKKHCIHPTPANDLGKLSTEDFISSIYNG